VDDPYKVLGVARDAGAEDIRKAYRRLAKQWHPDTNPDKPEAEARFKDVSAAYALLSDPEQRGRFDRGEIDASGAERASPDAGGWRDWAETGRGARYRSQSGGAGGGFGFGDPGGGGGGGFGPGGFDESDLEEFLARAFGARAGRPRGPRRGADLRVALRVPFLDAARGAVRTVTLPEGRQVQLTIPAGIEDGTVLRLAGQGLPGEAGGAPAGDLLAVVEVEPHRVFRREGNDILIDLPVTLKEAVLGARVEVPTIAGPVSLTIPPHSTEGQRLRLRGRGVNGGHQVVVLRVRLPAGPEPELEAFLKDWTPRDRTDPRAGMDAP
jgi:DnaJ-class molecular chaperone